MRKGFTLMELIIVVIIVGILAMVGLPQYFKVAERGRATEALAALGSLRNAQLRYATQDSGNSSSGVLSTLDVSMPTMKFFSATPAVTAVANPGTTNATVASIGRVGGGTSAAYTITISGTGYLACSGTGCPPLGN